MSFLKIVCGRASGSHRAICCGAVQLCLRRAASRTLTHDRLPPVPPNLGGRACRGRAREPAGHVLGMDMHIHAIASEHTHTWVWLLSSFYIYWSLSHSFVVVPPYVSETCLCSPCVHNNFRDTYFFMFLAEMPRKFMTEANPSKVDFSFNTQK